MLRCTHGIAVSVALRRVRHDPQLPCCRLLGLAMPFGTQVIPEGLQPEPLDGRRLLSLSMEGKDVNSMSFVDAVPRCGKRSAPSGPKKRGEYVKPWAVCELVKG